MTSWLLSADALPLIVMTLAFVFALAATFSARASNRDSQTFITLLFEAVTLGAGIVIVASFFYKPLFEWATEHASFMAIVALSTVLNALKDIAATIDRSRARPSEKK